MFEDNAWTNPQALTGGYNGMAAWGNGGMPSYNSGGYDPSNILAGFTPGQGISALLANNPTNYISPEMGGGNSFLQGLVGTKETPGWGGLALGGASALLSGIMGFKQLGLAKKSLAENKRQFGLNFDAQRRTTNAMLEDRQRARVSANPGAYESVGSYMDRNGIRG